MRWPLAMTSRTGELGRLPSVSQKRFQGDRPGIRTVSAGERRMRNVAKATQPDAIGINTRVEMLDWTSVSTHLDDHGWAMVEKLLTADECETIAGLYDDDGRFRSHVVMARHGFGRGEYKYFTYPLPDIVADLRRAIYPNLAPIANRWNESMGIDVRYPDAHADFIARCHKAGQTRPTPLLLQYAAGDYNALHQDLYGEHVFPLQMTILLSEPEQDFTGGEFVLTEQRPRMQSRAEVAPFRHMVTPGGYRMSVAMTNCGAAGWVTDRTGYRYDSHDPQTGRPWPAMPDVFADLAAQAAARAGFDGFAPDACLINRYEPGARLSLHQDKNERDFSAPIVSVSLGLPAVFLLGGLRRADTPGRVPLVHGDVVVWGGPARLRYHGVLPLEAGHHLLMGGHRINLTFRRAA